MLKSVWAYAAHKIGGKSLLWLHQQSLNFCLKGLEEEILEQHVSRFLDLHLLHLKYPPAIRSLMRAQNQGSLVFLLSSSPDFIVKQVAQRLGITVWRATKYNFNAANQLSQVETVVDGKSKADFVKEQAHLHSISKSQITVYSDSFLDLPLFEEAGIKVAVRPDRKLAALSKQNHWHII